MIQNCLGPYRLLKVVHVGHLSQLWQAYDDGAQRMIAIKAAVSRTARDSEPAGYLRQEFKVGREVKHPRVIEVFNFEIDRTGTPFMSMEWFPAPNLKRRIRTKEDREKLYPFIPTVVEQAAEGLGWMHTKGWVHRDIKPENFLVNDTGQVKLIDFGLAVRPTGWLAKILSTRPKRQGTSSYMSPEQIRCAALDQRADVYSFGCMLYEIVAGVPPYTGSSQEELFGKHLKFPVPPLEAADNNVTVDFANLVRRCLSKDAAGRPASAQELLESLRKMRMFRVFPHRSGTVVS
ncbi:MAG: serine/threonine protein kinase [Thermoguttaceae bacterium]